MLLTEGLYVNEIKTGRYYIQKDEDVKKRCQKAKRTYSWFLQDIWIYFQLQACQWKSNDMSICNIHPKYFHFIYLFIYFLFIYLFNLFTVDYNSSNIY